MIKKWMMAPRGNRGTAVFACILVLAVAALVGCEGLVSSSEANDEGIDWSEKAVKSVSSSTVLARAQGIAPHNRPYVFNGVQDCYGYVRQVWNAILYDGSMHSEDFYPKSYNKSRWLSVSGGLPVADYPSSKWVYFSNPNVLLPGDVLSTHQGHAWGGDWHGGIYAGVKNNEHRIWDNSGSANGAYNRSFYWGFHYYYRPTHDMLAGGGSTTTPPVNTTAVHVTYQTYDDVRKAWLPNVTDTQDYAGIFGHDVDCIYANLSSGSITYKVHYKGGSWLPAVTNRSDYAGMYNYPIDGLMMTTNTGKTIHYRVHLRRTGYWLPWVTGYNASDENNGYAGILGQEIDGVQIYVD